MRIISFDANNFCHCIIEVLKNYYDIIAKMIMTSIVGDLGIFRKTETFL